MKPRAGHIALGAALCLLAGATAHADTISSPAAESAAAASPLTLAECYQLALARSEEIAIQQERLTEVEGRFRQAFSGILPRASFISTDKRQESVPTPSSFTLEHVPDRRFNFSQPLFAGFKEFAAMKGSRAEQRQRAHEKQRAEQLLLVDVAEAFYLLAQQREELQTLEGIRSTVQERIAALKDREAIGRSRLSEVVSAEAQVATIEAELEQVRSVEVTARQLLEFLTGREPIEAIDTAGLAMPVLESDTSYLAKAAQRPDVQAANEAWEVSHQEVRVAKSAFWPTLDLEGNYYVERVGVSKDVNWDVLFTVDVPLFQGGEVAGRVRETSSRARQAKLQLERTRRTAALDIRDRYAELVAAMDRHEALAKAADAVEKNYRLQVEDYNLNLVSNLDVLQVLQELQDIRRDVIAARYAVQRLYWQLSVATGETL